MGAVSPALLHLLLLVFPTSSDERSRAEAEVKRLREARDKAYETLATAYAEAEAWYLHARENQGEGARGVLESAARAGLDALAVEEREGKIDPAARGKAQGFLRQRLLASLPASGVPSAIAPVLGIRLSESLAAESPPSPAEAAAAALAAVLDLERPFHESWNGPIFRESAAARDYAAADKALQEAGTKLQRLVRPDRFHPAYAGTPEGMVLVPGGTYKVGGDMGWDLDTERTKKSFDVAFHSFYIDRTEVTNARYKRFLDSLPASEALKHLPGSWPRNPNEPPAPPPGREEHPVGGVTLEDALAFAAWAGCRLPTEDEWSLAARGPQGFLYSWGNVWDGSRCNHLNAGLNQTMPVGAFPTDLSPFGCLDMSGNVSEWTASFPDGRPVTRLRENANVILRGGSFRRPGSKESVAWRWAYPALTTREADIGFRCAKDAPER